MGHLRSGCACTGPKADAHIADLCATAQASEILFASEMYGLITLTAVALVRASKP